MKLLVRIFSYFQNYKRLGFPGIILILKLYFKKNQIIAFLSPRYLHTIFLRNNTSDISAFTQVFLNQEYLIKYGFEPKVILDCGANVGYAAVYFKNKFPNAKIVSIEPDSSNFELLQKNTEKYNDINCLKGAIWNKKTNLKISGSGVDNWSIMVEESSTATDDSVKAYTIEEIMKIYALDGIDIIKIDIEGSEKELFESNFEKWLPKTKVIIIELHDRMRKGSSKAFFTALSNYNFSIAHRGENIIVFMN